MTDSNTLRNQHRINIRKQRKALSSQQQTDLSQNIAANLVQSHAFRTAKHIAFYLPVQGEADPTLVLDYAGSNRKTFYLPIISQLKENQLFFAPSDENSTFYANKYDIPEPICHPSELRKPRALDLIIMPLVGFDLSGNRLGMGGGYYDRSFAFKRYRTVTKKPLLIGYAYDFQKIDQLPSESWDIPLDAIVTNHYFRTIGANKIDSSL